MAHHRSLDAGNPIDVELDSAVFARVWNKGHDGAGSGVVLSFNVGSRAAVDELYTKVVAAGYEGQQTPCDAFWGARFAIVRGPGEVDIGLTSDPDEAFQSQPPDPAGFGA